MSKQKCASCAYFSPYPLGGGDGECEDPNKLIVDKWGDDLRPDVCRSSSCKNHKPKEKAE